MLWSSVPSLLLTWLRVPPETPPSVSVCFNRGFECTTEVSIGFLGYLQVKKARAPQGAEKKMLRPSIVVAF